MPFRKDKHIITNKVIHRQYQNRKIFQKKLSTEDGEIILVEVSSIGRVIHYLWTKLCKDFTTTTIYSDFKGNLRKLRDICLQEKKKLKPYKLTCFFWRGIISGHMCIF
jgi:hypothetical protein